MSIVKRLTEARRIANAIMDRKPDTVYVGVSEWSELCDLADKTEHSGAFKRAPFAMGMKVVRLTLDTYLQATVNPQ